MTRPVLTEVLRTIGAIVLKFAYGYSIAPDGSDPLVHLADVITDNFSEAVLPGKWIVDTIPICKNIRSFLISCV